MKSVYYRELEEECKLVTLSNGLPVCVIPKPCYTHAHAFYAVNYGSVDTSFIQNGKLLTTPNGIAHYLEHKMFDMPYGDAMNQFAKFGGNPNAFTSYNMTAYYVDCTENWQENLTTLLEFVSTPYFTEASVEKERGIIAQEIKMYEDNPDSRMYDDLFKAVFRFHPIRVPIAGTVQSIEGITARLLEECHSVFYSPGNSMLCVMGNVDADEVAEIAEKTIPKNNRAQFVRYYGKEEPERVAKKFIKRKMEVSMPSFLVGFKLKEAERGQEAMKAEYVGDLAADLLLGCSSRLYQDIYEKGLIDSSFSAGYDGIRSASVFTAGGDSRDPDAVMEAIVKAADNASREGFEDAYFQRIVSATIGRKLRDVDSFENTCYRICSYAFDGADYFSFREVLRSITQQDVCDFLKACLMEDRSTLAVIYPKGE